MFWKKKINYSEVKAALANLVTKNEPADPDMFEFQKDERRNSYRVFPAKEDPILLRLEGRTVEVKDISAAGLSFRDHDHSIGELFTVNIDLPGLGPTILVTLQILEIDEYRRCHCKFLKIDDTACERIHQYVLNRQKEVVREIREIKKKKTSTVIKLSVEPDEDSSTFQKM